MDQLPISLIVDDGTPVEATSWTWVGMDEKRLFTNTFTRAFGQLVQEHGVKGKYSVLPMPGGLGRIDEKLAGVPAGHLATFLKLIRQYVAPNFDITPEFLTHAAAVDLKTGFYKHVYEDVFADEASVKEMTEYFVYALQILKNVGLPANGMTSPFQAGEKNEKAYAEAIARSIYRVHRKKFSWYFLHGCRRGQPKWPWVTWRSRKEGMVCVTVPTNTRDVYWESLRAQSKREARRAAMAGVETQLTADGKSGRLREVFEAGCPLVMLAHWQCLYGNGRCFGLMAFERLLGRIEKVFGDSVRWMTCSEIAKLSLKLGKA